MAGIPKIFLSDGLSATKEAKEAVARITKMIKKEVIPESKLIRQPSSDLFTKATEMNEAAFWDDVQNIANYAKGEYIGIGGAKKMNGLENYFEEQVLYESEKLKRLLVNEYGTNGERVLYMEINPKTRERLHVVELDKKTGRPLDYWNSTTTERGDLHNYLNKKGQIVAKDNFATRERTFLREDGITPKYTLNFDNQYKIVYDESGKLQKKIYYADDYCKKANKVEYFDAQGDVRKEVTLNPETHEILEVRGDNGLIYKV